MPTILLASASLVLGGCANLLVRTKVVDEEITRVYQPTRDQAGVVVAVACPQSMFHPTGKCEWDVGNVLTVPFAALPAADLVLEAVLDTVFLPVDLYVVCRP